MSRVVTLGGEAFDVKAVAGILNVFEVRAAASNTCVGFIQLSPFAVIPLRRTLATVRLLKEVYASAVEAGLMPAPA